MRINQIMNYFLHITTADSHFPTWAIETRSKATVTEPSNIMWLRIDDWSYFSLITYELSRTVSWMHTAMWPCLSVDIASSIAQNVEILFPFNVIITTLIRSLFRSLDYNLSDVVMSGTSTHMEYIKHNFIMQLVSHNVIVKTD
jgi:hypothetical protein